jgi:hypothetical protein
MRARCRAEQSITTTFIKDQPKNGTSWHATDELLSASTDTAVSFLITGKRETFYATFQLFSANRRPLHICRRILYSFSCKGKLSKHSKVLRKKFKFSESIDMYCGLRHIYNPYLTISPRSRYSYFAYQIMLRVRLNRVGTLGEPILREDHGMKRLISCQSGPWHSAASLYDCDLANCESSRSTTN